ncbi:PREDICTED: ubiquitin carboxyl-terminal hydrolase 17-like protein 17-like [Chrysochloris asiatica]|uniref:Ubiquitin carboxyl-terminal hydrolase n=1 Tax=Chrysochloris asiatica TaxID=185453 RepID=A0A9B0T4W3_CHRAS|nr:PREDICTED: ubiquitin carboxyl-terminal hydrolase 17-like protein 17-like [Chrysochloris asiatica]
MPPQKPGAPDCSFEPPRSLIENLPATWSRATRVGAGLRNMGNTCYVNAALQCLTHTPPLAEYMLSREHSATCRQHAYCVLCTVQAHITQALCHPGHVLEPSPALARGFHRQQQEDAHEFLMFTLDGMQKASLPGNKHSSSLSEDNGPIRQIFGGYWRSRVKCLQCQAVSDTFDPYLDITLDIQAAESVKEALQQLSKTEELAGENCYYCNVCQRKVPASKTLNMHTSPEVLMLVLKRFSGMPGHKAANYVHYEECLDLGGCLSEENGRVAPYRLYAVLVHSGPTCHSGHYLCYVRAANGEWYQMDDAKVSACHATLVLKQQAYILFYIHQSQSTGEAGSVPQASRSTGCRIEDSETSLISHTDGANATRHGPPSHEKHPDESSSKQMTLEEWKSLQARESVKPEFKLREIDTGLPSNAVVIHKSKASLGPGKDWQEEDARTPDIMDRYIPGMVLPGNIGYGFCGGGISRESNKKKKKKKKGKGPRPLEGF